MSNLRNLNNAGAPLLDFLSSLNISDHSNHPFFAAFNPEARDRGAPPSYPGAEHQDPPEVPPPSNHEGPSTEQGRDPQHGGPAGPEHHRGRGGYGGRGGCSWGGPRRNGRCGMGIGTGYGGPPRPFNHGGDFDMNKLGDFLSQFISPGDMASSPATDNRNSSSTTNDTTSSSDFTPPADIFSTADAYVVHVSLPGAKKDDVGVSWDADKSELSIAGVIYRPGDEDFLKTLALDERQVGVFERKIKLGDKENPASVDADGIGAKMEDGILRVTVPKVESFVEVRKVDIE